MKHDGLQRSSLGQVVTSAVKNGGLVEAFRGAGKNPVAVVTSAVKNGGLVEATERLGAVFAERDDLRREERRPR